MTLTYVHTRGQDRDKWSPEGRKERIETGAITQSFIHIPQNWRSLWWRCTLLCGQMYEHWFTVTTQNHTVKRECNIQTYPHTLTQWQTPPARTEPLVYLWGVSFYLMERRVKWPKRANQVDSSFSPIFSLTLCASHQTSSSCSILSPL